MAGIVSYGAYLPLYRLSRAEIAKAWGQATATGEKAVAGHDEDSVTMATAAAIDCLKGISNGEIDGIYFASTTSPYREKLASATVAAALGMRREILTADFSNSLRAATSALAAALDAVKAGRARNILVISADLRLGLPKGENEMTVGDGASAVLIGNKGVIAEIEGIQVTSEDFFDTWRTDSEYFIRTAEGRFRREAGYGRIVPEAISSTLHRYETKPSEISKAILTASEASLVTSAAKAIGFDPIQVQDTLLSKIGHTGSAHPLMLLVAALEEAKSGDRLLLASYGDGCDVCLFRVTDNLAQLPPRRGVKRHLTSKSTLPSYQKYVQWRQLMAIEPPPRPPFAPLSPPALWRDREWGLAITGSKCRRCGTPQYPSQRVCTMCQTEDEFDPYSFRDKKGRISSFSHDNLAASIDPPTTVVLVDFEEGGRLPLNMTDRNPDEVRVGMDVELSLRRLYTVEGIHNYWWKCITPR